MDKEDSPKRGKKRKSIDGKSFLEQILYEEPYLYNYLLSKGESNFNVPSLIAINEVLIEGGHKETNCIEEGCRLLLLTYRVTRNIIYFGSKKIRVSLFCEIPTDVDYISKIPGDVLGIIFSKLYDLEQDTIMRYARVSKLFFRIISETITAKKEQEKYSINGFCGLNTVETNTTVDNLYDCFIERGLIEQKLTRIDSDTFILSSLNSSIFVKASDKEFTATLPKENQTILETIQLCQGEKIELFYGGCNGKVIQSDTLVIAYQIYGKYYYHRGKPITLYHTYKTDKGYFTLGDILMRIYHRYNRGLTEREYNYIGRELLRWWKKDLGDNITQKDLLENYIQFTYDDYYTNGLVYSSIICTQFPDIKSLALALFFALNPEEHDWDILDLLNQIRLGDILLRDIIDFESSVDMGTCIIKKLHFKRYVNNNNNGIETLILYPIIDFPNLS